MFHLIHAGRQSPPPPPPKDMNMLYISPLCMYKLENAEHETAKYIVVLT